MDMHELKPCQFCEKNTTLIKISSGYSSNGTYSVNYEISCASCKS